MKKAKKEKVKLLALEAAVYIPFNCEPMRVDYVMEDEEAFYGTGEESGESFKVTFEEVDLKKDQFYKLVLIET